MWWAYTRGAYIRGGLYSGGLIFGGAYIWKDVSVSTCGGLIHGGAYIRGGGLIVRSLRYRGEHLVLHIEAGV